MFITPAYAQTGNPAADLSFPLIPMLLMLVHLLFPRIPSAGQARRRAARASSMQCAAATRVVTSGGMVGKVTKVSDTSDEIEVELADNLKVRVVKSTLLRRALQGRAGQGRRVDRAALRGCAHPAPVSEIRSHPDAAFHALQDHL